MISEHILSHFGGTAELKRLEHLWNHEKMFEIGVVRANEWCEDRRHHRDISSSFSNMKEYCVFLLESPHRGHSNEYP